MPTSWGRASLTKHAKLCIHLFFIIRTVCVLLKINNQQVFECLLLNATCCLWPLCLQCWAKDKVSVLMKFIVQLGSQVLSKYTDYNQWASLVAQTVNSLPAMQETWVQFLGWEDPMEREMATHSSTLAWKISWTEKPGGLQSMGLQSWTWLSD